MSRGYFILEKHSTPIFLSLSAALIYFQIGSGLGWVAPAIVHFTSGHCELPISKTDISWIASMYFFMEIISPILAALCSRKIGRKSIIIVAAFFAVASWIVVIFAHSAHLIILSRALLGTCAGFFDITWSIYLGEFATPAKRGILGSIMTQVMISGLVFEFLLSMFVPYRVTAIVPGIIAIIGLLLSLFIVEAPQFLLMKGKERNALKALVRIRGELSANVQQEFDEMKQYIEEEKNTVRSFSHFFKSTSEYKVYIMCVLSFGFVQFSGNMTITSYLGLIMRQYPDVPSGNDLSFLYGVVQFIFINLSPFIIDRFGRKILLSVGFGLCGITQMVVAFLFYVDQYKPFIVSYIPIALIVLFNAIGIIFAVLLVPTVYVIRSELFPQELKMLGSTASTVCNAAFQFISIKLFIPVWSSYGIFVNFIVYAFLCLVIVLGIFTILPETRGKSLVEIQRDIAAANMQRKTNKNCTEEA